MTRKKDEDEYHDFTSRPGPSIVPDAFRVADPDSPAVHFTPAVGASDRPTWARFCDETADPRFWFGLGVCAGFTLSYHPHGVSYEVPVNLGTWYTPPGDGPETVARAFRPRLVTTDFPQLAPVLPAAPPRVVVTGGRDYADAAFVDTVLGTLLRWRGIGRLAHGSARGLDALADQWARGLGNIPVQPYRADWDTFGRRAGPMLNRAMLDAERPDVVIAFPGGRGTADCVAAALERRIPVLDLRGGAG